MSSLSADLSLSSLTTKFEYKYSRGYGTQQYIHKIGFYITFFCCRNLHGMSFREVST